MFSCSGGQTRTADLSIMSRALSPTELRRLELRSRLENRLPAASQQSNASPASTGAVLCTPALVWARREFGVAKLQSLGGNAVERPSPLPDLNRRPLPYHGSALPTELRGREASLHVGESPPCCAAALRRFSCVFTCRAELVKATATGGVRVPGEGFEPP